MASTDLRAAAQQALEYMKSVGKMDMHPEEWAIVGRLEAALAEPVQEPYTDDVTRIMHEAGMTFHLGLPRKAVVEQMTRVVDLVYAESSIKAAQQFATPPQRPAEPVQEPVGAVLVNRESREGVMFYSVDMIPDPSTLKDRFELVPVYTAPPPRVAQQAEPTRAQRLKDAGFKPRDNRLQCDECGKKFTRQMLPIHKCEPVQAEPDSPERRCGGPGCDMKCCQPVREPVHGIGGEG